MKQLQLGYKQPYPGGKMNKVSHIFVHETDWSDCWMYVGGPDHQAVDVSLILSVLSIVTSAVLFVVVVIMVCKYNKKMQAKPQVPPTNVEVEEELYEEMDSVQRGGAQNSSPLQDYDEVFQMKRNSSYAKWDQEVLLPKTIRNYIVQKNTYTPCFGFATRHDKIINIVY